MGIAAGVIVVLFLALFVALSIADSPTYAWRVLRYGESDIEDYKIFPERPIQPGTSVSVLPGGDPLSLSEVTYEYEGETHRDSLDGLLEKTDTRAFLIVQDDEVRLAEYLNSSPDDIHTSFSSAKSFDSAMIGAAIAEGYIDSVDDLVIKYIPEMAGRGLDTLTIRDLLLMNSGIQYAEGDELPFYMAPFADDAATYYSSDMRQLALSVQADGGQIGEAFHYNNFHPLLEGLIIERATGMPVAEYLQDRFWQPMGAEAAGSWSLDSESSGFEKMESGINAHALDFARFGLIFLHDGRWNGTQILPEAWVRESTQPLRPDARDWRTSSFWPDYGGYYKYHWWGINNDDGSYDFYAKGKFDQIVYVAPRKNAVVVRLGGRTDDTVNWALAIHSIVDQLP
jgi:CubicO group peptidase (beta-lactamase class C family)